MYLVASAVRNSMGLTDHVVTVEQVVEGSWLRTRWKLQNKYSAISALISTVVVNGNGIENGMQRQG